MKSVFIDSDIFIRDLRYPRDVRTKTNRAFLDQMRARKSLGVTSIFNVLEVCGILSFNLSEEELLDLYADFCAHYRVNVLFPGDASGQLHYDVVAIFQVIMRKTALGDAQIAYVIDRYAATLAGVVSWNAVHFKGRVNVPVWTPEEYLHHKS